MKTTTIKITFGIFASAVLSYSSFALELFSPSNTDLWDISQGTTVSAISGTFWGSDARDMFGGNFSTTPFENGRTIFADENPSGFTHFVEWHTLTPVTVGSFSLFASGDGPALSNEREFSQFILRAKSSPSSSTYDLLLYSCDTSHPYAFVDASNFALIVAGISPVTAQYFRAEFVQFNAGRGYDGPRIMELDAFAVPEPNTLGFFSILFLCWSVRKLSSSTPTTARV